MGEAMNWGNACEKCGEPVYPPTSRYQPAAHVLGARIWHGWCFPPGGVIDTLTIGGNLERVDGEIRRELDAKLAAYESDAESWRVGREQGLISDEVAQKISWVIGNRPHDDRRLEEGL
jgi:hypothetical protein